MNAFNRLALLLLPLVPLAAVSCAGDDADPGQPAAAAEVDHWIATHPSGWSVTIDERDPRHGLVRAFDEDPCGRGADFLALRYAGKDADILLSFDCSALLAPTTASLRQGFRYAALEALPHGLALPSWKFLVITPVSSFSEGVDIVSFSDGRLHLKIDTPLFAVRADNVREDCRAPADSSTPARCIVQREHRIPLHLDLTVPFDPASAR
jgi:hypothetical protein